MKTAFYIVDGNTTTKTLDAWDMITAGAKSWRFALNEDQYSAINWQASPKATIDQHAAQHARDLRQQHKKLRLWYSSGRDSNFILNTFIANNIMLDEICFINFGLLAGANRTEGTTEAVNAIKKAYQNSNQLLPKVTIHDVSNKQQLEQWKLVTSDRHSGGSGTATMSFNSAGIGVYMQLFYPDDYETCNIVGLEKPRLLVKDNKVFFYMVDLPVQHSISPTYCIDWFFMSPAAPELTHCQAHALYRKSKIYANVHFAGDHGRAISALQFEKPRYNDLCLMLGLGPAASMKSGFALGKATGGFTDPFYQPVMTAAAAENWDALKYYNVFTDRTSALISKYAQTDPDSFRNNFSKLPGIVTKMYYLGDLL